ncbi:MAG: IclR family transcriptional regulator, partial [Cutibacterium sp.]|nr:IclR family transcriptional regulator [Cutibacterium sp.]
VTVGWSTLAVPVVDVSGYPLASLTTTYRTALESSQLDQALLGHLFAAARAIQYRLGAR